MKDEKMQEGCSFCNALLNGNKITWEMRSSYADDNICDKINGTDCDLCKACDANFSIGSYVLKDEAHVYIEFEQHIGTALKTEAIIHPLSESVVFNYCPVCGKKLSSKEPELRISNHLKINS